MYKDLIDEYVPRLVAGQGEGETDEQYRLRVAVIVEVIAQKAAKKTAKEIQQRLQEVYKV